MNSLALFEGRFLLNLPRLFRQKRLHIKCICPSHVSLYTSSNTSRSVHTSCRLNNQFKGDKQFIKDKQGSDVTENKNDVQSKVGPEKDLQERSGIISTPQMTELSESKATPTIKIIPSMEDTTARFTDEIFEVAEQDAERGIDKFETAIRLYTKTTGKRMRGQAEFITKALSKLKDYNLNKELLAYKSLFLLMPEGKYRPKTTIQAEFFHYPKEQILAIDILNVMEENGVIPDKEMIRMIANRFSKKSEVYKKIQRMLYWLPKFRHINPYPIPFILPDNRIELAKLALNRMSHDENRAIEIWETEVDDVAGENNFIVSSQSPQQKELLAQHSMDKPLYVEGGFNVYLRNCVQTYFVLKADRLSEVAEEIGQYTHDIEDFCNSKLFFDDEFSTSVATRTSVHEQEDGVILAMCITGTNCQNSLNMWIRFLQRSNPKLDQIPVLFKLKEPDYLLKETEENIYLPS